MRLAVGRRDYPAMSSAPWQLRIHVLARELLEYRLTPAVTRELARCAELRWAMISAGQFN